MAESLHDNWEWWRPHNGGWLIRRGRFEQTLWSPTPPFTPRGAVRPSLPYELYPGWTEEQITEVDRLEVIADMIILGHHEEARRRLRARHYQHTYVYKARRHVEARWVAITEEEQLLTEPGSDQDHSSELHTGFGPTTLRSLRERLHRMTRRGCARPWDVSTTGPIAYHADRDGDDPKEWPLAREMSEMSGGWLM